MPDTRPNIRHRREGFTDGANLIAGKRMMPCYRIINPMPSIPIYKQREFNLSTDGMPYVELTLIF